ncbi:Pal1-domain-containing protein [Piedraia hortae CBS 480.64]|uniref:Pal1-domain-containing protein n=1 Tax=Piedraia hortae CBS 480.64 TaxID=1314780 RepID=A0A6A7BU88_9PEZI|nr:Pal1-domain-containing protein [Piedraia hortae CBS 480.64]
MRDMSLLDGPATDQPSRKPVPNRPRGASESSVFDERERRERREREHDRERQRTGRPHRSESEERRRQRRKERERERDRDGRDKKDSRRKDRPMGKPPGLDIIDKLDVTGVYGQGLFHHDGPFDACNPHRNKPKSRRPAPMEAFPADSANMALGGSGPLRNKLDLDRFHGRGEEGFSEFSGTRKASTSIVNPTDRTEQVHGDESYGLGTSTFLEGAPATRSALQRRESEDQSMDGGGLSRKKSLAQRFRGMSNSRRGELRSPDEAPVIRAMSAGGPVQARYNKENEVNPFDTEYDAAFARKGQQIRIAEQDRPVRTGTPGSPNGPSRSRTVDYAVRSSGEEERPQGSGLLSRMRSMRGGRRARRET